MARAPPAIVCDDLGFPNLSLLWVDKGQTGVTDEYVRT